MAQKTNEALKPDIRNFGKYIGALASMHEGEYLLGKCYFASCARVDRKRDDRHQDKQIIKIFIDILKKSRGNALEKSVEEDAINFLKIAKSPKNEFRYGGYESLFDNSLEHCTDEGYYGIGKKLISASEELKKELPQVNKQDLENRAILIILKHLKPIVYRN